MKWKKEHLILLVIIAALAAYLIVQKSGRIHYVLPSVARIAPKDITQLRIKNKDSLITLTRKGASWVIEPQGYPANKDAVDGLLRELGGLTLTALASEGGNDAVYDLGDDRRIEADAYEGNKLVRELAIGKTAASGEHTFVKLDRNAGIFHADHDLRRTFDKTLSALRDKTVMKVTGDITGLTLTKGRKTLTIEKATRSAAAKGKKEKGKGGAQQGTGSQWKIAGKNPANDAEVNGLVGTLSNLTCEDFIEGKAKKDFHAPLYTVVLSGAKAYTLSIYKEKDKTFAAVSSESPYPFKLSDWQAKKVMKDFREFASAKK
jgi:Domain of unknown function (DUF4340)